ncbi:hypothetical protein BACCIP111899_03314 [Bacillus rhizoplanae]|uniref:Uncharacterized protein n=1 Tax=Bacillus rhizoplanae TaxID=2880966 RepID=A0ABN8A0Q5_9BACI|nr:hypothetical protein [Bacillus rhizoplanae]CAG9614087.1 hypothetical protein BACCIP111899_03314 [Bacillus rhizoplanae]
MSDNYNEKNVGLSPPWVIYFNELKFSIGENPGVTVGPLIPAGDDYIILVTVTGNEKARAIATILNPTVNFGNINVNVVVSNREGQMIAPFSCPLDAFEIAHVFQLALEGNPFFEDVVVKPQLPGEQDVVYPVFKPKVIQFFNDDISNLCNTFVAVAANVFKDVILNTLCDIPILFSTSCGGTGTVSKKSANFEMKNQGIAPRLFYKEVA